MNEAAVAAREAAGERASAAKEAARDARGVVNERALAAREATVEAIAAVKPKLRGVSHEWAFFVSLVFGAALIFFAKTPKATLAVAIYAVSLSALLGTSALYHRVNWKRPNVRQWMRRLDHSMIFFLIAGTYTPFALLAMHGTLATAILVVVWTGAIAGAIVEMVWIGHPKWVSATVYLAIGWVAAAAFPELWSSLGPSGALLLAGGGRGPEPREPQRFRFCSGLRGRTDNSKPPDPGQGRIAASPIRAGRSSSRFDLDASVLQRKIGRLRRRAMVPDRLCSGNNRGHLSPWCAASLWIPLEELRFAVGTPLHSKSAAVGIHRHPFFCVVAGHVTTSPSGEATGGHSRERPPRERPGSQNFAASGETS